MRQTGNQQHVAPHSFMNDWGTPRPLHLVERIAGVHHGAPQAEDAWRRILAFFDAQLR